MHKYNINNFYVGKLNLGFKVGNLLIDEPLTKEEHNKYDLLYSTIANGAINLHQISSAENMDWNIRRRNESVLTIFYKNNDNYYCLHNGNNYQLEGMDFCSELVPITECLPKYGYHLKDEISVHEVKGLFKNIFGSKRQTLYNNEKFDIDDFYYGYIDICTEYTITDHNSCDKTTYDYDLPRQIILLGSGSYSSSGYYDEENIDDKHYEIDFSHYQAVFLQVDNDKLYNLYDYKIYRNDLVDGQDMFASIPEIKKPLKKAFEYNGIPYEQEMTIPKILKLQNKITML